MAPLMMSTWYRGRLFDGESKSVRAAGLTRTSWRDRSKSGRCVRWWRRSAQRRSNPGIEPSGGAHRSTHRHQVLPVHHPDGGAAVESVEGDSNRWILPASSFSITSTGTTIPVAFEPGAREKVVENVAESGVEVIASRPGAGVRTGSKPNPARRCSRPGRGTRQRMRRSGRRARS